MQTPNSQEQARPPNLRISSTNDHQDEKESRDSRFKVIWDAHMGGIENAIVPYQQAHVLLLSWDKDADDLDTDSEVKELEAVFSNTFNYDVTRRLLRKDPRSKAQNQANRHLACFVDDYDDDNTLLVIYYAGHGKRHHGSVVLEASKTYLADDSSIHEIVWNSAECNIKGTKSDVLVIFDCCAAGALDQNVRSNATRPAFEFLAATSANSTTRRPGPRSFTRALIYALEELAKTQERFTIQRLLSEILKAPNFPSDQGPRLGERGLPSLRRIALAPLKLGKPKIAEGTVTVDSRREHEVREELSTRFVFNKEVSETLVKNLAVGLRKLLVESDFQATVVWERLGPPQVLEVESAISQYYAAKWLLKTKKMVGVKTPDSKNLPQPQEEDIPGSASSVEGSILATPEPEIYDVPSSSGPLGKQFTIEIDVQSQCDIDPNEISMQRKGKRSRIQRESYVLDRTSPTPRTAPRTAPRQAKRPRIGRQPTSEPR